MEAFVLCQVSCSACDIMVDDLLQLQPSMHKCRKLLYCLRKCITVAQAGLSALTQVELVKVCCTSIDLPALTQVLLHNKDTQSLLAPVATVPAALPVSLGSGMHPLLLRDEARVGVPGRPWLIS